MPDSTNISISREQLHQRRKEWMREREITKSRQVLIEETNTNMGIDSDQNLHENNGFQNKSQNSNNESSMSIEVALMGRLSAKIEDAVRVELSDQVSRRNVEKEIEKLLNDELSTHCCPICMNIMTSKDGSEDGVDHSPILLSPCGHSLCCHCVGKLKKEQCPYCRQKIDHRATNRPLLEMIVRFCDSGGVTKKLNKTNTVGNGQYIPPSVLSGQQLRQSSDTDIVLNGNKSSEICSESSDYYQAQYRSFNARTTVLEQELDDVESEMLSFEENYKQLIELEKVAKENEQRYHAKWLQAKSELEECRVNLNTLDTRKKEGERKRTLLEKTLEPLKRDRDKCKIMLKHHGSTEELL